MRAMCLLTLWLVLAACGPSPSPPTTTAIAIPPASPASTPTTSIQEPLLVFFTSEPGKFQVWLPLSQSVQEYTVTKTLFGEPIECPVINSSLNGANALVQYCDPVFESIASLSGDEILDQTRGEVLRGIRVDLDPVERMIVQDTDTALALSGQADMRGLGYDGVFKGRIILAENRIYLVAMSVYHEDWCNCLGQIDQVIDSLFIEPDLSIPDEPAS